MENINFYKINDSIFYDIGEISYTLSDNIEEDIKKIKSLTYPPYTMTFDGIDVSLVINILNLLLDDLNQVTSLKKTKRFDKTFNFTISIEPINEAVLAFKLNSNDDRIVKVNSSNPYYLKDNDLIETTQYKILNDKIDCYYLLDDLNDEEYKMFDELKEMVFLKPDNVLTNHKEKVKA